MLAFLAVIKLLWLSSNQGAYCRSRIWCSLWPRRNHWFSRSQKKCGDSSYMTPMLNDYGLNTPAELLWFQWPGTGSIYAFCCHLFCLTTRLCAYGLSSFGSRGPEIYAPSLWSLVSGCLPLKSLKTSGKRQRPGSFISFILQELPAAFHFAPALNCSRPLSKVLRPENFVAKIKLWIMMNAASRLWALGMWAWIIIASLSSVFEVESWLLSLNGQTWSIYMSILMANFCQLFRIACGHPIYGFSSSPFRVDALIRVCLTEIYAAFVSCCERSY